VKAQDVIDQLSKVLPRYTSGFSDSVNITGATVAGTLVSVTTSAAHNLVAGQNVVIDGVEAPVQINVASFLRTGSSATFETDQEHDFTLSERDKAQGGKTLTISGANEAEFTGTFQLIGVPNRNKLVIAVTDSGPTTISGTPLVNDANGSLFNGLFPVSNVAATTFDYTIPEAYTVDPVLNNALVQTAIRIAGVLDITQYLQDVFTKRNIGQDTLVVQLGDVITSKSRDELTDADMSASGQYSFNTTLIQPFSLYIIQNTTDQLTGYQARDKVEEEYVPAIFHAIMRAKFPTGFTYSDYRATFTGHGVFAYSDENGKNKALYVHEVTFEQIVQLTGVDAAVIDDSVAMRDVSYALTTSLGTGELSANVNLDADAEPEQ